MFFGAMAIRLRLFVVALATFVCISTQPIEARARQTVHKSAATTKEAPHSRFANEAYVIEQHIVKVRFETDGAETRELSARVRIQTDAGAEQFRQLGFGFISPNEEVSVRSATIREPNGSGVNILAQPDAITTDPSPVAQKFPAYSNLKQLRIAAPNLKPGDTLEYDVVTRIQPAAAGEFWLSYDFPRDAIILDDRLELNLPQGRAFSIKAPGFSRIGGIERRTNSTARSTNNTAFTRTDEGGRTILGWKRANLKRPSSDGNQPQAQAAKTPDVQITSFRNWTAVAKWYARMERPSSEPSPQIRSKAQRLIHGAPTDSGKARAIFAYVSEKIRNVDLPDGFGRLAPRPAHDVLATGYGDPQEKNALLGAMLDAAGIPSNVALIAHGHKLEPGFPSPAPFDRAVTTVRDGEKLTWIDPSATFAPFGFLPASLRRQDALLIQTDGAGKIVRTPADPPFLSTQKVEIDAQLSELGKLTGTARYSLRGDTEYLLRNAFHHAPESQWKSLGQTILTLDGLRGEVTSVTSSDPLETDKPFHVTIAFSDPSAFIWPVTHAKIALPLLTIGMPDPPEKDTEPIELGTPLDVETHLRLRFPPNFTVTAPAGTTLARDYADFKSTYHMENGDVVAERSLNFKSRELPSSRRSDYVAFARAVQADAAQPLLIAAPGGEKPRIPSNATAGDLLDAGTAALKAGNAQAAILLLRRATQLQPNHKSVWNELGLAYLQSHEPADAVAAFQKQAQVNPSDDRAHDYLGVAFEQLHRDDDAVAAFQKQVALQPLDPAAHAQLGNILLRQERYSDAVPELEKAALLSPDNAEIEILLGRGYLNIGDTDKGLDSLRKAIQLSPGPRIRNEAAYTLAEEGAALPQARKYAEAAIRLAAEALDKTDLAHVTSADFAATANIGAYWDTLGWIYFKEGDLERAERYVHAAWLLTENGAVGDHLAQIYIKSGRKDAAIHQCALALATSDPVADTRARLMLLLGGNARIDDLVSKARPELEKPRTLTLKLPVKGKASADFLIALSPGGKTSLSAHVDAVRFVSGDESLRRFADDLKSIDYGEIFPDPTSLKLIRRGTLACSGATAECTFVLSLPEERGN